MYEISLVGKEYYDTILCVDQVNLGETNACISKNLRRGGTQNFLDAVDDIGHIGVTHVGQKHATILSDLNRSMRTSFVSEETEESLSDAHITELQNHSKWVHIMYLDDLGGWDKTRELTCPISVDFCTTKDRRPYMKVLTMSSIIFDSRERKELYRECEIEAPIVLHDEYGAEVIQSGEKIFSVDMVPTPGLEVNGAGDIFASYFLQNLGTLGLFESTATAMNKTTSLLTLRNK
tara:strand:- start:850 stop:1551 length:702 start_codon:yes stop_codon:yes gene_type:complete